MAGAFPGEACLRVQRAGARSEAREQMFLTRAFFDQTPPRIIRCSTLQQDLTVDTLGNPLGRTLNLFWELGGAAQSRL